MFGVLKIFYAIASSLFFSILPRFEVFVHFAVSPPFLPLLLACLS